MPNHLKMPIIFLTLAALILVPFTAEAIAQDSFSESDNSGAKMAADLILIRPLGIVATVFGSAVFVVSLPFSLLGRNTGEAFKSLMAAPAKHTFVRPLGEM